MRSFVGALMVVLLFGSMALGQVGYPVAVGPAPVVSYYAPGPVFAPPVGPVVRVPARYYVAAPVVYNAPIVAAPVYAPPVYARPIYGPSVYAAPFYGRPVVVSPKVYIPGQPVRNVIRAVTP